ncbi:hypothetical protein KAJ41_00345 [Candidatus Parcubacteria bacterium]|nr:hypothetical protein [Candidatus Parcubacteria bacterium]
MTDIGFTTGCLYKTKLSYFEIIFLYKKIGTTAIELSFGSLEELDNFSLSSDIEKLLQHFSYISIHIPWIEINYDINLKSEKIIGKIKSLCEQLPIKGIVVHPNCIGNFEYLESLKLPFLLENLNKGHLEGISSEQFKKFRDNFEFDFVFDLQHAFEHDQTMNVAKELLGVMKDKIKHIHISGQNNSTRHLSVVNSDNQKKITQILKICPKVPIICEGIMLNNFERRATEELNFIKENL